MEALQPQEDRWSPLKDLLSGWLFTEDFAVSIGTAEDNQVFLYQAGNMTMHTPVGTASTSKWPSAMMLAGLVNDGTISSLDDPANKYLSWWTKDPADKRSKVTLRHLLSFTSGFGGGHPGNEHINARRRMPVVEPSVDAPVTCLYNSKADIDACAKQIYNRVKMQGEPG